MARQLRFLLSIDRPMPLASADILDRPAHRGADRKDPSMQVAHVPAEPLPARATSRARTLDSEAQRPSPATCASCRRS